MTLARRLKYHVAAVLIAAVGTVQTATAQATEWVVQAAGSSILFEYTSDGVPNTGVFGRFEGTGNFNQADPASAQLLLQIDTASIDLNDALASAFAQSAEWFDSKNHPNVIYRLLKLNAVEGNRYAASGLLTIRGKEQPITSEIALDIEGERATAQGALVIERSDYLLGVGPSAVFVDISDKVTVRFDLQAVRSK